MTDACLGLKQPQYWRTNGEAPSSSYYRARYYDPTSGRFLSEDPLHFWAGANFYPYTRNQATQFRDPSGDLVVGAVVGAVIGVANGAIGAGLQGGSTGDIVTAAIIGGVGGAALGLVDPTEGAVTLVQFGLLSGALGIASDTLGQAIGNLHKPRQCRTFNLGEAVGAGLGGFVAGAAGGFTAIAAAEYGMGELDQALTSGGVGGVWGTLGGPAGQAVGGEAGGGGCGCQ